MGSIRRRHLSALVVVLAALICSIAPTYASGRSLHPPNVRGPKAYYLSLGDSLAFGYQPYKPLQQGFGYYDFLSAALERVNPELSPVNLGCPGETTVTFIKGGCPNAFLNRYQGSQLSAALAFLTAHPGQVSPITYVLGANDILPVLARDPSQLPAALQQVAANEDTILKQIRQAAPTADIVTIDYYQPLAVAVTSTAALSGVVAASQAGNAIIDQTAARYNVKVANIYAAFNTPVQSPLLCQLTWMCGSFHDIHPTVAGYSIMTGLFEAALGYPGLATQKVTNPLAVSVGAITGPATITWMWAGDQNAEGYDAIVYHYDSAGAVVQDRSETLPAGQHSYALVGTTCDITYELKIRSRGPYHPAPYFTPAVGKRVPCLP